MSPTEVRRNGIKVPNPNRFLSICRQELEKKFNRTFYWRSIPTMMASELHYLLSPPEGSAQDEEDGPRVPVFAAGAGKDDTEYWLAANMRFIHDGAEWFVDHTSVHLYSGKQFVETKKLCVRGEWDLKLTPAILKSGHAQPHWHLHLPSTGLWNSANDGNGKAVTGLQTDTLTETGDATLNPATEFRPPPPNVTKPASTREIYRLHLAMSARWHIVPPIVVEQDIDAPGLARWFAELLAYLVAQIEYATT